jgi:hypothetical protein
VLIIFVLLYDYVGMVHRSESYSDEVEDVAVIVFGSDAYTLQV